jgi:hypothetical protein
MALINCPECNKDVSDKASSCPFCGHPIADSATTIELTNKKWKKFKLAGLMFFVIGLFVIFKGGAYTGLGVLLWLTAFVLQIIGKTGAWWTNG